MKKLQFSLESARRWQEKQFEIEEARLQQVNAGLNQVRAQRKLLENSILEEGRRVSNAPVVAAPELALITQLHDFAGRETRRLAAQESTWEKRLAEQQQRLTAARKKLELLNRLRERAQVEWRNAFAKEQEDLAAELFLAKRARQTIRSAPRELSGSSEIPVDSG